MRTRIITNLDVTPRFFLSPLGAPAMAPADEPGAIFGLPVRRAKLVFSAICVPPSKRTKVPARIGYAGIIRGLSLLSSVLPGVRLQVFAYLYAAEEIEITQHAQGTSITFTSLPN